MLGYDDYYPFGLAMPGRSLNSGTPNDLNKFTGHERDQEGGLDLDYMLARNYDPEIGRFYSVDPLQFMYSSTSSYAYVLNNPLNFIDPTGMEAIESTHLTPDGEVIAVYDDGDFGVYVHSDASTKAEIDKKRQVSNSTSGGGKYVGETLSWNSFAVGNRINLSQDSYGGLMLSYYSYLASQLNILEYAIAAIDGNRLDAKKKLKKGGYLNGTFGLILSTREIGNIVAGIKAGNSIIKGPVLAAYGVFNLGFNLYGGRNTDAAIAIAVGGSTMLLPTIYRTIAQEYLYNFEDEVTKRAIFYGIENY